MAKANLSAPVVAPASQRLAKQKGGKKMEVEMSAPSQTLAPRPAHSITGTVSCVTIRCEATNCELADQEHCYL